MSVYLNPDELRVWANERHQRLIQEGQEAAASQRRLLQQLGAALNRLGQQFVLWGQQIQARSALPEEKELYHDYPSA